MRVLVCAIALAGMLLTVGCGVMPMSPVVAPLTLNQRGAVAVGPAATGTRVGRATAEGILIVSYGDASIEAAMEDGKITKIHHVDNESLGVLGVYARQETIVYGE